MFQSAPRTFPVLMEGLAWMVFAIARTSTRGVNAKWVTPFKFIYFSMIAKFKVLWKLETNPQYVFLLGLSHAEGGVKCSAIGLVDVATERICRNAAVTYAAAVSLDASSFGGVSRCGASPKGCYIGKHNRVYWQKVGAPRSYPWAKSICQQRK